MRGENIADRRRVWISRWWEAKRGNSFSLWWWWVLAFTRRVKSVERFIKRNGLLCGEKQFPAKQGIKYLSLRAAVQFSERRYPPRHPRRRLATRKNLSRSRYYAFPLLSFALSSASSYILHGNVIRTKGKKFLRFFLSIFFLWSTDDGWDRGEEK